MRLKNVVEVDADAGPAAGIDLVLVQVSGRVHEPTWCPPGVVSEPGTQPVVGRPVAGLGITGLGITGLGIAGLGIAGLGIAVAAR